MRSGGATQGSGEASNDNIGVVCLLHSPSAPPLPFPFLL